ncbi:MAG: cellulase family glycosylhydrolase [Bacteroidales bacterium]
MKLINTIFTLFLFMGTSCTDDDNPVTPQTEQSTLSVDKTSISADAQGEDVTIAIESNAVWVVSSSNTDIVISNISQSKGNANIILSISKNMTTLERSATIKVSVADGTLEAINIEITQAAATAETDYLAPDQTGMRDITSLELSQDMGLGWNLGNTLESYPGGETSWGNPTATQALINLIKASGFKTVRIPVAWSNHLVSEAPDYKILEAWMSRVKDVVDYAISSDMYAIINIHWDGGWADSLFYSKKEEIEAKQAAIWKQIAKYFRDYDDHLLFAGGNEPHVDYNTPSQEYLDVANAMNQVFVNTVRATGGRNYYRHLISQGYNTNITHTLNGFVLPTDKSDIHNRQMVEVHFYDPYDFALNEKSSVITWDADTWGQEDWVDEAYGKMKAKFVDNGVAVLMGEYGAIYRSNLTGTELEAHRTSLNHYLTYVTKAALKNNIVPIYWDNGAKSANGFALFDRNTNTVFNQESLDAIINASK